MGCGNIHPQSESANAVQKTSMAKNKLYYFNARGIGETIRLIFVQAGEQFDDIRIDPQNWPNHKPDMPLGQMPVLEIDNVKIPQSLAIGRYLARRFHLTGTSELEQLKVDACVHAIAEYRQKYIQLVLIPSEETVKDDGRKQMINQELPNYLPQISKLLRMWSSQGPFFLGDQLTWADLICFDFMQSMFELDPSIPERFPRILQQYDAVMKQPRIATYLSKRPTTSF